MEFADNLEIFDRLRRYFYISFTQLNKRVEKDEVSIVVTFDLKAEIDWDLLP